LKKKSHFQEIERYWVNKPYACVVIFHSKKENEKKYYVVQPHLNEIEGELKGLPLAEAQDRDQVTRRTT